jgi:hypothetical protein
MLHAYRLGLSFAFQGGLEVHMKLAVQHFFGLCQRKCGASRESIRHFSGYFDKLIRRHNPIV